MKKKTLIIMLVLLALVLSGCACEHEWADADCLNPQICRKCEETGAEALGHDWMAASCTAAETCSRCGETQGQPLKHSYGSWTFGETDMTHSCESCGQTETAELDRDLLLESKLQGLWELAVIETESISYTACDLPIPGENLHFTEDHRVSGDMNGEPFDGTWEFGDYESFDGDELYRFRIHDDDRSFSLAYVELEDAAYIYCIFADNVYPILTRNDALAALIYGTWKAPLAGDDYTLTFHEDRTVTGLLDQQIQGTWQLTDVVTHELAGRYCAIFITIEQDGEEVILQTTVLPEWDEDPDSPFVPDTLTVRTANDRYRLYR